MRIKLTLRFFSRLLAIAEDDQLDNLVRDAAQSALQHMRNVKTS